MPVIYAYAPGKVILTGEHAVVYGQPAIAAPVNEVKARAAVEADPTAEAGRVRIVAPDISLDTCLAEIPEDHPIATIFREVKKELGVEHIPALTLTVTSSIPIAAGLGSGAAISVAVCRALSAFLGNPLPDESVSRIAFEVDRYYHGTPSGIDNTVISYARMIFFTRGKPIEILVNRQDFTLVIADSGEKSLTASMVQGVRTRMESDSRRYQTIMEQIGSISLAARGAIQKGDINQLGSLFNDNHALLQQLGVSTVNLDLLVHRACEAGALGAKLSGAGGGGNIIVLVNTQDADQVAAGLLAAGAVNTIVTTIPQS